MLREYLLPLIIAILVVTMTTIQYETYKQFRPFDPSDVNRATVIITDDHDNVRGTGFFISSDGLIFTAAHVIESIRSGKQDPHVMTYGSTDAWDIDVIMYDIRLDMALIRLVDMDETKHWLQINNTESIQQGEQIYVVGHPAGATWTLQEGILARKSYYRHNSSKGISVRYTLWVSASVMPGNSGGPIVNRDGEVVCMVTSFHSLYRVPGHLNLCTPGTDLIRFAGLK